MRALEVNFNNEKIIFGPPSEEGIMNFIISIRKNEQKFKVSASGYDPNHDVHYDWIKTEANYKDEITIKFVESLEENSVSAPLDTRSGGTEEFVLKEKVKYYHNLKAELEEKGLI